MLSLLLVAPLPFVAPAQDARAALVAHERTAFERYAGDDTPGAMRAVAEGVRAAALALAREPSDEELADEIEFALLWADRIVRGFEARGALSALLSDVSIDPRHGMAYARLAWLRGDTDALSPLVRWSFVGPFDNERGTGMRAATPAELDPDATRTFPGKVREVGWRVLPDQPPAHGAVRFSQLVDPSEQVCVLARSWIESETDADVMLLLGAEDEVRVWLAGRPVLDALRVRRLREDALAVRLPLAAGWNELALEVGARDGTPTFVARLVDPETGTPLALPQTATPPPETEPLALTADPAPATPPWESGKPGIWSRVAKDESAEGAYRRSVLEECFQPVPESEKPGRALAAAAVEREPDEPRYLVQHALTLFESTSVDAEKDVNPWLFALDRILEREPDLPLALRWKALHAWKNQPTPRRALELLDRLLAKNPRSIAARSMRADVLQAAGQEPWARAVRRSLVEDPDVAFFPNELVAALEALPGADPRRLPLLDTAIESSASIQTIWVRDEWGRMRDRDRSVEGALGVLAAMLERDPWSVPAHVSVIDLLLALDRPEEALDVVAAALAFAPERASLYSRQARALLQKGDEEAAIAALEHVLEFDYTADDERRLLEHLKSLGAAPFHEAFAEPLDAVLARDAAAERIAAGDVSREVLLQRIVVDVSPDGTAKRYFRRVQRVLAEAGAQHLDRVSFHAYPGDQEARVLAANVRKTDGTIQQARTGRGGARGGLWVDLPPLQTGDVVDLEWRIDDLRTTFFGNYFGLDASLTPDPSVPVYESEIVLLVPDSFPLSFHERNFAGERTTERKGDGVTLFRWRQDRIAPVYTEDLMPPLEEASPTVQASSYESWEEFGTWWWHLIESEMRVSPEMASRVRELVADAETPLERVRAIYDFVVTDIRYNAWEFGVHGYQPYSAPVIFSRGFGDCKDKAILLRALLSEIGVEAYPTLIRAEGRRLDEDHALALVEHFNHCIAFVPPQEGLEAMFLDGTARHHPLETLPQMDAGADVLVVKPDGVEQREVPVPTAEENRVAHEFVVTIDEEGRSIVDYTRHVAGTPGAQERARFAGSEEERVEEAERMLSSVFGPLSGRIEARFSDVEDLEAAVVEHFRLEPERIARKTARGFELPTSFQRLQILRTWATETERTTDLLLDVPWSRETTIEYRLGEGQSPGTLPAPVSVDCEDASYRFEAQRTDAGFLLRETFSLRSPRIPPERYGALRDVARKVDQSQAAFVEVEVKP